MQRVCCGELPGGRGGFCLEGHFDVEQLPSKLDPHYGNRKGGRGAGQMPTPRMISVQLMV